MSDQARPGEVKTIIEVERIVHASGEYDGATPVEFSNDGQEWVQTWEPSAQYPYPSFARVAIYRKGVRLPAQVTARWVEHIPHEEEWHARWCAQPMRQFGRTVRMFAFRQAFRDLLGDARLEDEHEEHDELGPDWAERIAEAADLEALERLGEQIRAARGFTPDATGVQLERDFKARRAELAPTARPVARQRYAPKRQAAKEAPECLSESQERANGEEPGR